MSQQSHISEGGFSDIISDVETFVKENDLDGVVNIVQKFEHEPMGKTCEFEEKLVMDEHDPRLSSVFGHPTIFPDFPSCDLREFCTTDYPGPLNFDVFVGHNATKPPWEYSASLNKVYIDMRQKFPIHFSIKENKIPNLFIRVVPAFLDDHCLQDLVFRCICHQQANDSSNVGVAEHVIQHIIRCDNNNARYFGDKDKGKHLSVVIPLSMPQPGTDSVKELFMFMCKSSCPGSMNRKPIQIIFTLEDLNGLVLGRRVLNVKICSCPKRDREKDEEKINIRMNTTLSAGKRRNSKRKSASPLQNDISDKRSFSFNIDVVGLENYKLLCTFCHNLMAAEIFKLEGKKEDDTPYRKCITDVKKLLSILPQD